MSFNSLTNVSDAYTLIMINKQRFFLITANVVQKDKADIWNMTKQIPAFIIDTEIQGLTNMKAMDAVLIDMFGKTVQYVAEPFNLTA